MNDENTTSRKINIIVVDDNRENLRLLSNLLTGEGYKVRPVSDGPMAILSAQNRPPDLILLDIMMSGMNGYEVCEKLKANEQTREIPVIFLSALNETIDKVQAFNIGGVDYITKPFQSEEVLVRVKMHLEMAAMQKRLQSQNTQLTQEITEHRQTKAALQRAKEVAEAANREKSMFLSNMSHELRSPLTAIIGFAQVMARSENLPQEHHENVDIIRRSGEHLLTLINQVLELSKIEAGQITLNQNAFDLHQMLHDVQDMFTLKADTKHLQLVFESDRTIPRYVRTDEVRLRQVLINLLNNAMKFTQEGSVALRGKVEGEWLKANGEGLKVEGEGLKAEGERQDAEPFNLSPLTLHLCFEVEDTGPGIDLGEIDTIFEAFGQTETGRQEQEGTGLGLTISRKFVQLMGGDMHVKSKLGQGTTFIFDIKVQLVDETEFDSPVSTRRVTGLKPGQPLYRILVADDVRLNRQLVADLLNPLGFEVREAVNGQEAIEIWKTWKPHLIWMDMRMPVLDGYETARCIKSEIQNSEPGTQTVIIALTASSFEEERSAALKSGCDGYLRKPFADTELFELMSTHIGVQFVYEEKTEEKAERNDMLASEALAALPPEWLENLKQGARRADFLLISDIIEKIRGKNAMLAGVLSQLAEDFDYDEILELLKR
ncbi:MAG: response regulator [Desulfobacterales bacterium]|nr:response regulator [Desulfobacterales bacterium]